MESRDPAAVVETLAHDVVLRSPIIDVPFEGREEAAKLFEALLGAAERIEYHIDSPARDLHVFAFRLSFGGKPVEGVDLVRFNDRGEATEFTVFLRPLDGIATFSAAVGPALAKGLGSSAAAVRAATMPSNAVMRLTARLAPRLLGMRRARR
jgi:hypothetical protein